MNSTSWMNVVLNSFDVSYFLTGAEYADCYIMLISVLLLVCIEVINVQLLT